MAITFTIPAVPVAEPRARAVAIAGKPRLYEASKSHPIHAFKATAKLSFAATKSQAHDGPISLDLVFVMPRPQNKRWLTKPMPRYPNVIAPDVDNLAKAVMDALNGLAWRDDKQVSRLTCEKLVAAGDEQPHVEVTIEGLS